MLTVRDFLMPDLGEGLTEGEINRWLVAEGDQVVVDQPVAEITTEKAVVEVPTPFAGRVATLHGVEGGSIAGGTPLISIEVAGVGPSESAIGECPCRIRDERVGAAIAAERNARSHIGSRDCKARSSGITAGAPSGGRDGHRPRDHRGQRAGRDGDAGRSRTRRERERAKAGQCGTGPLGRRAHAVGRRRSRCGRTAHALVSRGADGDRNTQRRRRPHPGMALRTTR